MIRKLRKRKCKECKELFTPTSKVNHFCDKECGTKFRSKNRVTCKYCKKSVDGYVKEKGESYRKKFCNLKCYGLWLKEAPDEDKKKGLSMDLDDLLDDLIPFLKIGLELQPSCQEIGVPYSTVHNYTTSKDLLEKYPELEVFKNEIQKAKNYGIKVSKNVIVSEIANNKNYKAAFDYLDRVDPSFAPKEQEETEEFEFGFSKSAFVTGGIPKEEKEYKEPTQISENKPKDFKIKIKRTKCLQNQRKKED